MPNYIKNRLTIKGTNEQIEEVFNKYKTYFKSEIAKSYDGSIICKRPNENGFSIGWFNPHTCFFYTHEDREGKKGLPEGWEIVVEDSYVIFPDFKKIIPPPNDDTYNDLPTQEVAKNHPNWWYNWNIKNWGTKWNISESKTEKFGTYVFTTAWNGVPELMLRLSKENPSIEFNYEYADEDTGYNCGEFVFKDGNVLNKNEPKGGTKQAYELSFRLRPHYKEYYVIVDGKYENKEDEGE